MAPPFRTGPREMPGRPTPREEKLRLVERLHPTERLVLRLKALIGPPTNKADFLTVMSATGIRAPDGKPWTHQTVNGALDRLVAAGLLEGDFSCPVALWHPLAVDALATPDGPVLLQAVLGSFPEKGRSAWGSARSRSRMARFASTAPKFSSAA